MTYRHVFGPVLSGRLGRSLGLDLLGAPICSMDCLYCEVGPTTALTTRHKPYVRAERLLAELAHWKEHVDLPVDAVTLGGMGEPTLNTDMARIIRGARELFPGVPVAVLTNATTLVNQRVRADLALADIVLPSMDSLVEEEFLRLCRPAPGITAAAVAQSILDFRAGYAGKLFLEVLLIAHVNDTDANLLLLQDFVARLRPNRVDVTTLSRPGAHPGARAVDAATLERFRQGLNAALNAAGAVPDAPSAGNTLESAVNRRDSLTDDRIRANVLQSVRRRPQTLLQLAAALGLPTVRVAAALQELERQGLVRPMESDAPGAARRSGDSAAMRHYGPAQPEGPTP